MRIVLLMLLCSPVCVFATELEPRLESEPDPGQDLTTMALVLSALDEGGAGSLPGEKTGQVGVCGYVEVTADQKSGLLTPFYRVSSQMAVKARVPLIFNRTWHYYDFDASASGLGDVTVDGEYVKKLSSPDTFLKAQLSIKLPTGDHEKTIKKSEDDFFEYLVPLGTGSTDILARGSYAKSRPNMGWVAGLLFRKNGGTDTVTDWGSSTQTKTVTSGNQLVGSFFARKRQGDKLWLHLGSVITKVGTGSVDFTYSDAQPSTSNDISGATLVDLHPGVSFQVGKMSPYLGVRLPIMTSFDGDALGNAVEVERDLAVIFQFTYRPGRMAD